MVAWSRGVTSAGATGRRNGCARKQDACSRCAGAPPLPRRAPYLTFALGSCLRFHSQFSASRGQGPPRTFPSLQRHSQHHLQGRYFPGARSLPTTTRTRLTKASIGLLKGQVPKIMSLDAISGPLHLEFFALATVPLNFPIQVVIERCTLIPDIATLRRYLLFLTHATRPQSHRLGRLSLSLTAPRPQDGLPAWPLPTGPPNLSPARNHSRHPPTPLIQAPRTCREAGTEVLVGTNSFKRAAPVTLQCPRSLTHMSNFEFIFDLIGTALVLPGACLSLSFAFLAERLALMLIANNP